ncbi:MAG: MATE family efflux transporter, partial [Hungatella sp.]
HWGVAGVAWATFLAQGVSAILALITLAVRLKKIPGEKNLPLLDTDILRQIAAIAIPSIMQQSVLSVGNLFVQDMVNQYGSSTI